MNLPAKFRRVSKLFFILTVCLPAPGSLVMAQEALQAGPASAGQNFPQSQILRRIPEQGEVPAEELLRLLELPAAQKALVLTDEQRKKIEDISFNIRRSVIQQQAAIQVQRLELERMMRAENPDRAAIDKKIPDVVQAESAIMRTRINALMDLRSILTKEQRDRIREFAMQRFQKAAPPLMRQAPGPGGNPPAPAIPAVPPQPRLQPNLRPPAP